MIMSAKSLTRLGLGLVASLGLLTTTNVWGQARGGGGGGFGGGGGGGGRGGGTGTTTRDYGNSTMIADPGTIFSYDPETRSLILFTDAETYTNISKVVARLDRPKPQVLISAVFLEVTHAKDLDVGLEGSYLRNFSSSSLINQVGLTNLFGLAQMGAVGSTIGQDTMPNGAGLYSVSAGNVSMLVRAIASKSKTEVLSRPSILVRNNQPATITVGESIPIITSVTYNTLGTPISSATYQNVGIILQVTPFITQDNLVEMIVSPQISQVTAQTVTIAQGVAEPIINIRSANTVVVTPDGQTVVIGGLMEHDNTKVDSKIPILGDIPGLGALFSHKQSANDVTELLIFITPHVVTLPSQIAAISAAESGKAEYPGKVFSERELEQFLGKGTIKAVPPPKGKKDSDGP